MNKLTPEQVILFTDAAIRCALLSVPYRHHGRWECPGLRGHKTGLDCAGLGLHCAIKAGADPAQLADQRVYSRVPNADSLRQMIVANCGDPVAASPAPGQVALFAQYKDPGHMGIFVWHEDRLKLVHADNTYKRTVMQTYTEVHDMMLVEVFQP